MIRCIVCLLGMLLPLTLHATIKVACVGDSITFGSGIADRATWSYPSQLEVLLGKDYEVKNFGLSGRTMLRKGDYPIWKEQVYQDSLAYQPDIVIIKLGTNDSKPKNWKWSAQFAQDTKDLVASYRALPSKPRVILCQPVPVVKDRWGIREAILRKEIAPRIQQVASENYIELIDLYQPLVGVKDIMPDGVHPNAAGAKLIAQTIYNYLIIERGPDS